jgi:hypothetical protein
MTSPLEEIDDPGEYNQRRRIRAIHDARERVFEQRRRGLDLQAQGSISRRTFRNIVRESVESFIFEIEQLLCRYQADIEPNLEPDSDARAPSWYLDDANLGRMTLPPDGRRRTFRGLLSVVEAPDPFVCEWQQQSSPPAGFESHPLAQAETQRREVQIPEKILLNAVRTGMQFLTEVGLDAEVEDSIPTATFNEVDESQLDKNADIPIDDRA